MVIPASHCEVNSTLNLNLIEIHFFTVDQTVQEESQLNRDSEASYASLASCVSTP